MVKGEKIRPIDADALIDDCMERYCKECDKRKGIKNGKWRIIYEIGEVPCRACDVDDLKAELENAQTVDVRENVHGKWIERKVIEDGKAIDEWQSAKCSVCGKYHTTPYLYNFDDFNYCPNCGAKMEVE